MPTIQNVSRACIETGNHTATNAGKDVVLIQISDPDVNHPQPYFHFHRIHQFKFLDIEEDSVCIVPEWRPSRDQAYAIASILLTALQLNQDVVVHCHAGICRSGAVAEAGEMLGFEYVGDGKQPNVALKTLLMEALGLRITPENSAFNQYSEEPSK